MGIKKEKKYITLKEAADISGYASDYVGQLIRSGKLEGKQVYNAVAWVTTEESVRRYVDKARDKVKPGKTTINLENVVQFAQNLKNQIFLQKYSIKIFKMALYFIIALSFLLGLLFFYVLSSSIESTLQKRAEEKLLLRSIEINAEYK